MSIQKGWIGVDLDGTLAHYDGYQGFDKIGKPIPLMVERVKRWLEEGREVKIMTARVSPASMERNGVTLRETATPIREWCVLHLGQELPITCEKDLSMIQLWDDRCIQVIPNTGETIKSKETTARQLLAFINAQCAKEVRSGILPNRLLALSFMSQKIEEAMEMYDQA